MKLLQLITSPSMLEAIGWTILHSLWQGAVVAALLAAVRASVRSSRLRYRVACLALLVLLGGFGFTLVWLLPQSHHGSLTPRQTPFFELSHPQLPVSRKLFPALIAFIPWLAPAWVCGVFLFYCRYAAGWLLSQRLKRRGVCQAATRWQERVARLAAELNVSRPVRLLESVLAEVPIVIGHFRPTILVPIGFLSGLPPEQIEMILLHELAHIKRGDYLGNICQCLAEGLLFYHPAAWWISGIIRAEREHCCDDIVVSERNDAYAYATALSALERNRLNKWPLPKAAVAAQGGNLLNRIQRLLYPTKPNMFWAPALAATVLLLSSGFLLATSRMVPATPPVSRQASDAPTDLWSKWLHEDVVYIISDEEKTAFERLETNDERQHFSDQFWARRNPAPDATVNEFKEEHYRRIAFANDHFPTTADTPGWQTDRGHIYIVYGPPDEIEFHPPKASATHAVYMWKYWKTAGTKSEQIFAFVDRTGDGDYRLGPDR